MEPQSALVIPDVRLLARAGAILRLFAGHQQAWRLVEIAAAVGLAKGTAHRVLKSLCAEGILQKSPDASYRLGPLVRQLAARAFGPEALRTLARPLLRQLATRTNETTLMFQLASSGDAAICIEQIESAHGLRLVADVGARLPLHAGGASRAILAFLEDEDVDALLCKLPKAAAAVLREQIAQTRRLGYALSFQETNEGVSGIAAPLFDPMRRVIGSVAIVGPITRMGEARLLDFAPDLMAAAAAIGGGTGGSSPAHGANPTATKRIATRAASARWPMQSAGDEP